MTAGTVGNIHEKTQAISALTEVTGRRVEFDYLRAFVIVLVLWHHAILAYATISFINPKTPIEFLCFCYVVAILVADYRIVCHCKSNISFCRNIDPWLGIACHNPKNTGGSQGPLNL